MADLTLAYALVGSVILLILVYVVYRMVIRRRATLLREGIQAPTGDRAFNQIRIARAGAQHLASQGHDVRAVTQRLDEAESRHRRGDSAGALELAERARTDLRTLQSRNAPFAGGAAVEPAPVDQRPETLAPPATPPSDPPPDGIDARPESPPARPPAGMVQARFTLSLLDQELERAKAERASSPELVEAFRIRAGAQSEFDQGRYVPAWQAALRARRRLGSPIEGVALGATSAASEPPHGPVAVGTANCTACGHPLRAGDRFCRGCGKSIAAEKCPRCGTTVDPGDGFCAACGAPLSA